MARRSVVPSRAPTPMPEDLQRPQLASVVRASAAYAARTREGLLAGFRDLREATLHVPAASDHARRFLFGLAAPFTLLRRAWRDPGVRHSVNRRLLPAIAIVALVAASGIFDLVKEITAARRDASALAAKVRDAKHDDDERDDDEDDGDVGAATRAAGKEVERAARDSAAHGGSRQAVAAAAVSAAAAQAELARKNAERKRAPPPPPPPEGLLGWLRLALTLAESRLAKLIATLGILEWILVWIGREHYEHVASDTARLTGVPGEIAPEPPRLRLDFAWLKVKAWRALRFVLFVASIAPVVGLAGQIPKVGGAIGAVVQGAWFAYWASVMAIGNSFLVWELEPHPAWSPWFMRLLAPIAAVPVLGIPFRLYARLLAWLTRATWPACWAFEQAPWEALGLALARGISGVPILYLTMRPMFGPAATHAFVARCSGLVGGVGPSGPPRSS
jgi:hypothetical protein